MARADKAEKVVESQPEPAKIEGSIGKHIDSMFKLRDQIRERDKITDELKEQLHAMESALEEHMKSQGLEKASGTLGTASLKSAIVPSVKDWDSFYAFIHKTKFYHLLERRAAAAAYRELLVERKNKPVPGVESFNKTSVSLTVKS